MKGAECSAPPLSDLNWRQQDGCGSGGTAPPRAGSRSTGCWWWPGWARGRRRRRWQVGARPEGTRSPTRSTGKAAAVNVPRCGRAGGFPADAGGGGKGRSDRFPAAGRGSGIPRGSALAAPQSTRAARPSHGCSRYRPLKRARPASEWTAWSSDTGYHRGFFENALEDHSREQVSGLLLLYSSCVIHVVESCSSTVHLIIQDLASLQNQGHGALLQEIKVLVVAHNIPTRLFPDWYVAIATSPGTCPQGSTQSRSTAEVVAECLTLLLKLAASIQSFEKLYGLFHLISLHDTGCIQCFSLQLDSFVFNMNLHIKEQIHTHSQYASALKEEQAEQPATHELQKPRE
ncbi:testis-expressed protein 47 [Ciconia maguari]